MSYQYELVSALRSYSPLVSLVGSRIYSDVADGSAVTPYLVYQVVATSSETTHDGDRSLEFPLIQFSAWDDTRRGAIALASALLGAIEGQTLAGASGVTCIFEDQSATYEAETELYGEIIQIRAATKR